MIDRNRSRRSLKFFPRHDRFFTFKATVSSSLEFKELTAIADYHKNDVAPVVEGDALNPLSSWGRRTSLMGDKMIDLKSLEDTQYLTVAEVALAIRVSKMTVYRLVHSGELTSVRFGRSYRVPAHAVQEDLVAESPAASPARRAATT